MGTSSILCFLAKTGRPPLASVTYTGSKPVRRDCVCWMGLVGNVYLRQRWEHLCPDDRVEFRPQLRGTLYYTYIWYRIAGWRGTAVVVPPDRVFGASSNGTTLLNHNKAQLVTTVLGGLLLLWPLLLYRTYSTVVSSRALQLFSGVSRTDSVAGLVGAVECALVLSSTPDLNSSTGGLFNPIPAYPSMPTTLTTTHNSTQLLTQLSMSKTAAHQKKSENNIH